MLASESTPRFKVVLTGDGGVGKSQLLRKWRQLPFAEKYLPTLGVDVAAVTLQTSLGPVLLDFWDCAGQEKFGGLRDGYYIGGNCGVGVFDLTAPSTARNVRNWIRDMRRVMGRVPLVVVGTKGCAPTADLGLLEDEDEWDAGEPFCGVFPIDVTDPTLSHGDVFAPLLALVRLLASCSDLRLVTASTPAPLLAVAPAEVRIPESVREPRRDWTFAVLGPPAVGKSKFISMLSGKWETSSGPAAVQMDEGMKPGTRYDAAVLMFSVTDRSTYMAVPEYFRDFVKGHDSLPMVLVGNKVDCKDRQVKPMHITFHRKKNLQYYDISLVSRYNVEKPCQWLMRKLTGDATLALVGLPEPHPVHGDSQRQVASKSPDTARSGAERERTHQDGTICIAVVGATGCGKTTFIERLVPSGEAVLSSSSGPIRVRLVEGVSSGKIDGLLLMFDVTSISSYKDVPVVFRTVTDKFGRLPSVLVGNKVDVNDRRVKPKAILFHRILNMPYYDISALSNYNFEKPLLYLVARALGREGPLELTSPLSLKQPDVFLDMARVAAAESELKHSSAAPLPDDSEDEDGREPLRMTVAARTNISTGHNLDDPEGRTVHGDHRRCGATTKKGTPCKNWAHNCWIHNSDRFATRR